MEHAPISGHRNRRHGPKPQCTSPLDNAVIVDVEATPARTYDEVAATKTMLDRTEICFGLKPKRLVADTAYGTGKFFGWLAKDKKVTPHTPVWEKGDREADASSNVPTLSHFGVEPPTDAYR